MSSSPFRASAPLRLAALATAPVLMAGGMLAMAPSASAAVTKAPAVSQRAFIGPVASGRTIIRSKQRLRRLQPTTPVLKRKPVAATTTPTTAPTTAPTAPTAAPTAAPTVVPTVAPTTEAPVATSLGTSNFTALRTADFSGGFDEWDLGGASVYPKASAAMTLDAGYDDSPGARASVPAGTSNKYARTLWGNSSGERGALDLGEGDDFTYGMALYLPAGFYDSMQSYFVPMRWDNYGVQNVSRGGLAMYSDGSMRLFRERSGVENQVNLLAGKSFRLSEGSWHWLEVRQTLSTQSGRAFNEVRVDGALIGSSTTANYYGEPVSAIRYGIVAVAEGKQTLPLTVRYDRAVLGTGRLGPLA